MVPRCDGRTRRIWVSQMRPTRQQLFMEIAHVVAKRSTCFRLNVGAVVVVNDRIVSIGYNGAPAGEPHCAGNDCPGVKPGHCPTIHAEENALKYAPPPTGAPRDLYVTHAPCEGCANLCLFYGVRRLFFNIPYRDTSGIDNLTEEGIEVYQVTPAGYVVQYPNREVVTL